MGWMVHACAGYLKWLDLSGMGLSCPSDELAPLLLRMEKLSRLSLDNNNLVVGAWSLAEQGDGDVHVQVKVCWCTCCSSVPMRSGLRALSFRRLRARVRHFVCSEHDRLPLFIPLSFIPLILSQACLCLCCGQELLRVLWLPLCRALGTCPGLWGVLQGDIAYFGSVAASLEHLESLVLSRNLHLTGSFGGSFCRAASHLTFLDVSFNNINGTIPACLLGPGASIPTLLDMLCRLHTCLLGGSSPHCLGPFGGRSGLGLVGSGLELQSCNSLCCLMPSGFVLKCTAFVLNRMQGFGVCRQ